MFLTLAMSAKILIIQTSNINPLSYPTRRPSVEIDKAVVKRCPERKQRTYFHILQNKILARISHKGNCSTTCMKNTKMIPAKIVWLYAASGWNSNTSELRTLVQAWKWTSLSHNNSITYRGRVGKFSPTSKHQAMKEYGGLQSKVSWCQTSGKRLQVISFALRLIYLKTILSIPIRLYNAYNFQLTKFITYLQTRLAVAINYTRNNLIPVSRKKNDNCYVKRILSHSVSP